MPTLKVQCHFYDPSLEDKTSSMSFSLYDDREDCRAAIYDVAHALARHEEKYGQK